MSVAALSAGEPNAPLKTGMKVAVIGDSITEQKLYSRFMETYLLACVPELDVEVCQFGWSGETAAGFLGRMDNDLAWFKPDVATICYGMNDGRYKAIDEAIEKGFSEPTGKILGKFKKGGAFAVVGGPGAVDTKYFNRPGTPAAVYNQNLKRLSEIAKDLAAQNGFVFGNLHDIMASTMEKAKEANGDNYDVCGTDGVHPKANGHLVMAYSFLKAMGLTGEIGTITVDMAGKKADASAGHRILSSENGRVEIESVKYPFCYRGNLKDSSTEYSITPFLPFSQELNRFVLQVKMLPWDKARVKWGEESKVFSKADLEKGVNLAAEFAPKNPFSEKFLSLFSLVGQKQEFETLMIKRTFTNFPAMEKAVDNDAEVKSAVAGIKAKFIRKRASLLEAVKKERTPVRHTIAVEKAD